MNIKLFTVICVGLAGGWLLAGCGDTVGLVGPGIQPEGDLISVYSDTFRMTASTVKIDSVYAKTISGFVGDIYDPLYGRLKSDYLCQFYCSEGFKFYQTPYEERIDSVFLYLQYASWLGDAYSPMEIKVHPVTEPLEKNYYSNVDATAFCDLQSLLGSQVSSAVNGNLDSTAGYDASGNTVYTYSYTIAVRLPTELGQKFYDATVQNPSVFSSQEAFNRFFPGVYVTTGYGSGTMLHIALTRMEIKYRYAVESSTGADSLLSASEHFVTTKDVIQMNRIENMDTEQLLADNDAYTFLKTPAGIYTRLEIPATQIKEVIKDRMLNNLLLELKYLPSEDWSYALTPPPYLLLLPEDSLTTFFENGYIENNLTTYLSTTDVDASGKTVLSPLYSSLGYNSTTRTYSFKNISPLLNYHLSVSPDKDLRLLVVPVSRGMQQSGNDYYSSTVYYITTSVTPYLGPSGVKLRKDGDYMKIAVLSSKFNNR